MSRQVGAAKYFLPKPTPPAVTKAEPVDLEEDEDLHAQAEELFEPAPPAPRRLGTKRPAMSAAAPPAPLKASRAGPPLSSVQISELEEMEGEGEEEEEEEPPTPSTSTGGAGGGGASAPSPPEQVPLAQEQVVALETELTILLQGKAEDLEMPGTIDVYDVGHWTEMCRRVVQRFHVDRLPVQGPNNQHIMHLVGRLVYAMTQQRFEPWLPAKDHGVTVWSHKWFRQLAVSDHLTSKKCFHGSAMHCKEQRYTFNPTTNRAKQLLATSEGRLVDDPRTGKPIVEVVNKDMWFCPEDRDHNNWQYPHSKNSCGLSFSSGQNAEVAMHNHVQSMRCRYPRLSQTSALLLQNHLTIVTRCYCNYDRIPGSVPGRQICKLVPTQIPGASDITDEQTLRNPLAEVIRQYPYQFTFQCCNYVPAFKAKNPVKSGDGLYPNCDFKVTVKEVALALDLAHECVKHLLNLETAPSRLALPRFTWDKSFAFKQQLVHIEDVAISEETDPVLF